MRLDDSRDQPVPTAEVDNFLIEREEAKRERMVDPKLRWQVLQQAIAWGEQQKTVRRNTREECLRRQAILLAGLGKDAVPPVSERSGTEH
ncbi:MAG: hypothetical protein K8T91_27870 [Planctomycetes bacterium]|nr:hypothetical protein [Planctomycetota bacterium]